MRRVSTQSSGRSPARRTTSSAICEEEADFFRDGSPDPDNVEVRPPYLAGVRPSPAQLGARHDLGFVAGWSAGPESPNADALEWFARKILPGVRAGCPGHGCG